MSDQQSEPVARIDKDEEKGLGLFVDRLGRLGRTSPSLKRAGSRLSRMIKTHGITNAVVFLWLMPLMSLCRIFAHEFPQSLIDTLRFNR